MGSDPMGGNLLITFRGTPSIRQRAPRISVLRISEYHSSIAVRNYTVWYNTGVMNISFKTRIAIIAVSAITVCAALICTIVALTNGSARFTRTYELNRWKYTIGVSADCDSERLTRAIYRDARIRPFDSLDAAAKQLMAGKIDALVYDEHVLRLLMWRYPDRFAFLPDPVDTDPSVIAVSAERKDLLLKLNAFIAKYRASGVYDDMFLRWCHDPERGAKSSVPALPSPPENAPAIRVGTDCDEEPNSFLGEDGEPTGFDIEFTRRFAAEIGARVEFVLKPEAELYADIRAGAIDMIVDNLDRRPDARGIFYSDGYLDSDIVMMIRAEDLAQ